MRVAYLRPRGVKTSVKINSVQTLRELSTQLRIQSLLNNPDLSKTQKRVLLNILRQNG